MIIPCNLPPEDMDEMVALLRELPRDEEGFITDKERYKMILEAFLPEETCDALRLAIEYPEMWGKE